MDRELLAAYLRQAERHVLEGEDILTRLRKLIRKLHAAGQSTTQAGELLATCEVSQSLHIHDRDKLRKLLAGDPPP